MRRLDGSVRWTETRGSVIRDSYGAPVRLVGMDYDITERKRVEAELLTRERQQAAVAMLGQLALGGMSAQVVMDRAVQALTDVLGTAFAKVMELQPNGLDLVLRAGHGSMPGFRIGETVIRADQQSQAGYTLSLDAKSRNAASGNAASGNAGFVNAGPVIVEDFATETRFDGLPLFHASGVVSGMSIVIRAVDGGSSPYGLLAVYTREQRRFSQHDIQFLEAVASLVTAAVQREQAEAALLERKARLRLFIEQAPVAIAMLDTDMRYLAASRRYVTDHRLPIEAAADLLGRHHEEVFSSLAGSLAQFMEPRSERGAADGLGRMYCTL